MHSNIIKAVVNAYDEYHQTSHIRLSVNEGTPLATIITSTSPDNLTKVGELDNESLIKMLSSSSAEESIAIHHQQEIEDYANAVATKVTDNINYAINVVAPQVTKAMTLMSEVNRTIPSRLFGENVEFVAVRLPSIIELSLFDEYLGRSSKDAMSDKSIVYDPRDILNKGTDEEFRAIFNTGMAYIDEVIESEFFGEFSIDDVRSIISEAYFSKSILDTRLGKQKLMVPSILSFLFYRGIANQAAAEQNTDLSTVLGNSVGYWGHVINQQVREYKNNIRKNKFFHVEGVDKRLLDGSWVKENSEVMKVTVYAEQDVKARDILSIGRNAIRGAVISGQDIEELDIDAMAKNAKYYNNLWNNQASAYTLRTNLDLISRTSYNIKRIVDDIVKEVTEDESIDFRGDINYIRDSGEIENYIHETLNGKQTPKMSDMFIHIFGKLVFNHTNSKEILISIFDFQDSNEGATFDVTSLSQLIITQISNFVLGQVHKS